MPALTDAMNIYMTGVRQITVSDNGGIICGHDYDQAGVNLAVQTLLQSLEKYQKKANLFVESCRDDHPPYPIEYKEMGFLGLVDLNSI